MNPIKVGAHVGATRPVVMNIPGSKVGRGLMQSDVYTVSLPMDEAEQLIADLERALRDAEPAVGVKLVSSNTSSPVAWSYLDPSGELEVGDLVEVPFGPSDLTQIGKVVRLGRGGYTGPLKPVTAKLLKREL